jgi:hypothetical protein
MLLSTEDTTFRELTSRQVCFTILYFLDWLVLGRGVASLGAYLRNRKVSAERPLRRL